MKTVYVLAIGKRYGTRFLLRQNPTNPKSYTTLYVQESAGGEWFNFGERGWPTELNNTELNNFETFKEISEKDVLVELL